MNVPEVVTKPKPNLPMKVEAFWNPAEAKLELQMELLPTSELSHHQLAAMFDGGASASVSSTNVNEVLKVAVTIKHTKDVAGAGKAEHDLHVEARDRGMHVDALKAEKKAQAEAKAKAEADAKAAEKKAKAGAEKKE